MGLWKDQWKEGRKEGEEEKEKKESNTSVKMPFSIICQVLSKHYLLLIS